MTTGVIYLGHDNVVPLLFKDGDDPVDLSGMTKIAVKISSLEKNSEDDPDLFDLTEKADGKIGLKFGDLDTLPAAEHEIRVTIYDATNDDGIVWIHEDNTIPLKLKVIKD